MRASARSFVFVSIWPILAALAGCGGPDPVTGAAPDTSAVRAAAETAAVAARDSGGASEVVGQLMASVVLPAPPAPSTSTRLGHSSTLGTGSESVQLDDFATCPPDGEIGAGISFTCTADAGTLVFSFSGTLATPGGAADLSGILTAVPSPEQPDSGARFDLEYSATIVGPGGTANWSGTGTLELNQDGEVSEFRLTATHVPSGGTASASTVVVTPTSFDLTVSFAGDSVRFFVDRASGTGTVRVDGTTVAMLGYSGGCFAVDYLDPALADETVCPME